MYATRDLDRMYNETVSLKRDRSRFVVHGAGFSQYHLSQTRNGKPVRRRETDTNSKVTLFAAEPTRTSKASLASAARKRRNDALLDARA